MSNWNSGYLEYRSVEKTNKSASHKFKPNHRNPLSTNNFSSHTLCTKPTSIICRLTSSERYDLTLWIGPISSSSSELINSKARGNNSFSSVVCLRLRRLSFYNQNHQCDGASGHIGWMFQFASFNIILS